MNLLLGGCLLGAAAGPGWGWSLGWYSFVAWVAVIVYRGCKAVQQLKIAKQLFYVLLAQLLDAYLVIEDLADALGGEPTSAAPSRPEIASEVTMERTP